MGILPILVFRFLFRRFGGNLGEVFAVHVFAQGVDDRLAEEFVRLGLDGKAQGKQPKSISRVGVRKCRILVFQSVEPLGNRIQVFPDLDRGILEDVPFHAGPELIDARHVVGNAMV